MDGNICFKHDINLQKISTIQVAAALWRSENMQVKTKTFASELEGKERALLHHDEDWDKITDEAMKLAESLPLPNKVMFQLKKMIFFTGERLYIWMMYVTKRNLYKWSRFSLTIWDVHGFIHEKKIYEDLKENQDFPGFTDEDENKFKLWTLASLYVDVECLEKEKPEELKRVVRKFLGRVNLRDVNKAMSVLSSCFIGDEEEDWDASNTSQSSSSSESELLIDDDDGFEQVYLTKREKLFLSIVGYGFDKAAEYFYGSIIYNSGKVLPKAACKCLRLSFSTSNFINYYYNQRDKIPEMMYILNKMSIRQKKEFLTRNFLKTYLFLLNNWPLQDLCVPLLDFMWNDLGNNVKSEVLKLTVEAVNSYSEINLVFYNSLLHPIMLHVLEIMPEDLKVDFFVPNRIFFELFEISNFLTVELILNDPHLANYRSALVDISVYLSDYLKRRGEVKNIKEYIDTFQFTTEEKKNLIKFSDDCDLFETLILQGRIEAADQILKLQCDINEVEIIYRKRIIREMLDPLKTSYSLIASIGFDTMEKYLHWQFDEDINDLEITKAKIFSTEFILKSFWIKWIQNCRDVESAKGVCSEMLKKFLKTDDEMMSFKEKILEDEKFLRILMEHKAAYWDIYDIVIPQLDEALGVLSFASEEVLTMKSKIKENFQQWFDFYSRKSYDFKNFFALHALIIWISDYNGDERDLIIKKHIKCRSIAKFWVGLCKQGLNVTLKYCFCKVKDRLLIWVKPYNGFKRVKSEIDKLEAWKGLSKDQMYKIRELLKEIECCK